LTAKDLYDICCPYTDGYFRSLLYDFSQIMIASEVLISTFTKNDKKCNCTEKSEILGNLLIGIFTTYIQKI